MKRSSIMFALPLCLLMQPVARADVLTVESYFAVFAKPLQQYNLRKLARCIAGKYPQEVQAALRADADLNEIKVNYQDLMDFRCASGALFKDNQVTLGDGSYQPILAEAMLGQDYASKPLPDITKAPPLEHLALPEIDQTRLAPRYRTFFAIDAAQHRLSVFGECVARARPRAAMVLAFSEQSSAQEATDLSNLEPYIVQCGGQNLGFAPAPLLLRGAISYNLYRLLDVVHPVLHEKVTGGA